MLLAYTMDVGGLCGEEAFSRYLPIVSDARREKIAAMRRPADRALSLGAGLALDAALGTLGLRERDRSYRTGENGKPYFADLPGLFFNLSHSGSRVLALLSDGEVGCDLEQIAEPDLRVAERFFHPDEFDRLKTAGDADRTRLFFTLWTAKESYMKFTGAGFRQLMRAFCVDSAANPARVLLPTGKADCRILTLDKIPGYCAAVCAEAFPMPLTVEEIPLLSLMPDDPGKT